MNEVEEIKEKMDIVDFIGGYLQLKKAGQNHKALCPFHNEKTPSFMVNPERQIFKCFGCGVGGDVFEFLMQMEHLEFKEALEILAERTGVDLEKGRQQFRSQYSQYGDGGVEHQPATRSSVSKKRLYDINLLAAKAFHKILIEHPSGKKALEYLMKKRGLKKEIIKEFMIGYAPAKNVLGAFLTKHKVTESESRQAGSPERFLNRIIFPISDIMGNIVGFTGRSMSDEQMPKYLNTSETVIFNKSRILYGLDKTKQAIKKDEQAVLVEGQMDVILSYQAGVRNAIASSGTALTSEQLRILARYQPQIILAYDQDEAGAKAAQRVADLSLSADMELKIAVWPDQYKDPGELAANSPEKWQKSVKQAIPYVEWLLDSLVKRYGCQDSSQKRKVAREILPILPKIVNDIERAHWIKKTAERLGVSEQNVLDALDKISSRAKMNFQKNESTNKKELTKKISADNELMVILASSEELWAKYHKLVKPNFLVSPLAKDIYIVGKKGYPEIKRSNSLVREMAKYTFELEQLYDFADTVNTEKGILDILSKLKDGVSEKLKKEFAAKINQAEKDKDRDRIKKLLLEFQARIKNS